MRENSALCSLTGFSVGEINKDRLYRRFKQGYEDGLQRIVASLGKKSGVKLEGRVCERVGRLRAKYPSIHKHYSIDYKV